MFSPVWPFSATLPVTPIELPVVSVPELSSAAVVPENAMLLSNRLPVLMMPISPLPPVADTDSVDN
jgi:hypothetical protein